MVIISDADDLYRRIVDGSVSLTLSYLCEFYEGARGGASSAPNVSRFYLAIFHACQWEIVTPQSYFLT